MEGNGGLQPSDGVIDCELSLSWNVAGQPACPANYQHTLLASWSAGFFRHYSVKIVKDVQELPQPCTDLAHHEPDSI